MSAGTGLLRGEEHAGPAPEDLKYDARKDAPGHSDHYVAALDLDFELGHAAFYGKRARRATARHPMLVAISCGRS